MPVGFGAVVLPVERGVTDAELFEDLLFEDPVLVEVFGAADVVLGATTTVVVTSTVEERVDAVTVLDAVVPFEVDEAIAAGPEDELGVDAGAADPAADPADAPALVRPGTVTVGPVGAATAEEIEPAVDELGPAESAAPHDASTGSSKAAAIRTKTGFPARMDPQCQPGRGQPRQHVGVLPTSKLKRPKP